MKHAELYKRTSTGKVQVWWLESEGDQYRTHSGQIDGKIVTSEWTTAKPKNVGRSNETSGEAQARLEVDAAYVLKQKGGYATSIEDVDAKKAEKFSPMLAKEYGDHLKKVSEALRDEKAVFVQPKLDGMRCIATKDGLFSRNGNPIVAVPHIREALETYFEFYPDAIFDGELYTHALKDDFPKLMSLAKKTKPTSIDLKASRLLEYHVYDMPSVESGFYGRYSTLAFAVSTEISYQGPRVICDVYTRPLLNLDQLAEMHEQHLAEGFEGTMIRLDTPYENKRTHNLLKYKEFVDAEFEIVSVHEGEGNRSGMAGYAVLRLPSGEGTFRSNIMGDRDYLRGLLARSESLAGKQATVVYFHLTPDGVPRFPRIKLVHETAKE